MPASDTPPHHPPSPLSQEETKEHLQQQCKYKAEDSSSSSSSSSSSLRPQRTNTRIANSSWNETTTTHHRSSLLFPRRFTKFMLLTVIGIGLLLRHKLHTIENNLLGYYTTFSKSSKETFNNLYTAYSKQRQHTVTFSTTTTTSSSSHDEQPTDDDTDDNNSQSRSSHPPPPPPTPTNTTTTSSTKKKLNILLLYGDDWRHDTLGIAGHPIVLTPHIDRLAAEGLHFTHNCVTTSICWISRASMYTGQYVSRHGTFLLEDVDFLKKWERESLVGLLRREGYHAGLVGKWHLSEFPQDGWDFNKLYYGSHREEVWGKGTVHVTKLNMRDSISFLRSRPTDKPFFLQTSFFATHAEDGNKKQYIPQSKSKNLYRNATITPSLTHNDESFANLPEFFTSNNEGRIRYMWRHDEPSKHEHMMKNMYRMATEVDTACGAIVKELKRQGIYDETLIIFTTDNGLFSGEHGLADKWYPHEESIRVPLVVRDPRMDPGKVGTTNDDFTLNIDLAPTILGAAGIEVPEGMQGRDIADLYRSSSSSSNTETVVDDGDYSNDATNHVEQRRRRRRQQQQSRPWRTEFFYEHPKLFDEYSIPASEALVRKKFKYFYWPDFDHHQLFDVEIDPHEMIDLANNPSYKEVMTDMKKRFNKLKRLVR